MRGSNPVAITEIHNINSYSFSTQFLSAFKTKFGN